MRDYMRRRRQSHTHHTLQCIVICPVILELFLFLFRFQLWRSALDIDSLLRAIDWIEIIVVKLAALAVLSHFSWRYVVDRWHSAKSKRSGTREP
jgi:hypothetical protein